MNQKLLLLHAFLNGKRFTVLSAMRSVKCYALSQRCGELRRMHFPIQDKWVNLPNGKRVKEYYL